MASSKSYWKLGAILILSSALLYGLHYIIFHDLHHLEIYTLSDLAYMPIEVLVVTLIIHRLLNEQERQNRLEKLNMVIGAFFSEAGTGLLSTFSKCDPTIDKKTDHLLVSTKWTDDEFKRVSGILRGYDYEVDIGRVDLVKLREFVSSKREFMVRLLENPMVLEHETFTELLRAVFHLAEELQGRPGFEDLPENDMKHLGGDIKRAYGLLVLEWISYMHYLKDNYPYLFSLSMRTNPFDKNASAIVK